MRTVLEPFGCLNLTVNGVKVDYTIIPMKTTGEAPRYAVDFRGSIGLPLPATKTDVIVTCTLENNRHPVLDGGIDTGENLAAVTFNLNGHRVTMGTPGDLPDREYAPLSNGLSVVLKPCERAREITFCIAEKRLDDAESIDTWLAVDIW